MVEKILVLSHDRRFLKEAETRLLAFGVDVVHTICEPARVPFGGLASQYNIVIVDKQFCGNGRNTSALVRRIRTEFIDPIIGLNFMHGDDCVSALQVRGCNYILDFANLQQSEAIEKLLMTVQDISGEMGRLQEYHRMEEKSGVSASPGRFKAIDLDIGCADGLYGGPEEGIIVLGEYRYLWLAKLMSREKRRWDIRWRPLRINRRRIGGRFCRQVHDDTGKCVYYFDGDKGLSAKELSVMCS